MFRTRERKIKSTTSTVQSRSRRLGNRLASRNDRRIDILSKRRVQNVSEPMFPMGDVNVDMLMGCLLSDNLEIIESAMVNVKQCIISTDDPIVGQFVSVGIIPRLVFFAQPTSPEKLRTDALWCLTNIASGDGDGSRDFVDEMMQANVVEVAISALVESKCTDLMNSAGWCLSNIAADNEAYRDRMVLDDQLMNHVIMLAMDPNTPQELLETIAWFLCNCSDGTKELEYLEYFSPLFDVLIHLTKSNNEEICSKAAWGLKNLIDGEETEYFIHKALDNGTLQAVVSVHQRYPNHRMSLCRLIGVIAQGSDEVADKLISLKDVTIIPIITEMLVDRSERIRRESTWILSNLATGPQSHVSNILNSGAIGTMIQFIQCESNIIAKEAAWVINNVIGRCTLQDLRLLVSNDAFLYSCGSILEMKDACLIDHTLDSWGRMLRMDQTGRVITSLQKHGMSFVHTIRNTMSGDIFAKADSIIKKYGKDEGEEITNLLPNNLVGQSNHSQTFTFGPRI